MQHSIPDYRNDQDVKAILEWLALAHGQHGIEGIEGLRTQLLALRSTALPMPQRVKLLDLLYGHLAHMVDAQVPTLRDLSLPVTRKVRQRVRLTQELLGMFAQDYLNTLAELFDPQLKEISKPPVNTLSRVMQCLSWQLLTSYMIAAPLGSGLWQQMHNVYGTARRLGIDNVPVPGMEHTLCQAYLANLLPGVAQPASFTSQELEFIYAYTAPRVKGIALETEAPHGTDGVFWIDPARDSPAHSIFRRTPPPDTKILYFSCQALAQSTANYLAALEGGKTAVFLGLPDFADTSAGQGVLRRLADIWGHPSKRRFSRRKQLNRAHLSAGLECLWRLLDGEEDPVTSEWMITNESPDGYAMMHVAGDIQTLRVGDIVAVQPTDESGIVQEATPWHVCIIRWALSENSKHIELGLQILSAAAVPATLALPKNMAGKGMASALFLPEMPPLRPMQGLIVPTGAIRNRTQKLILLMEKDNLTIRELYPTSLDEQTSSVEVFSVDSDETPLPPASPQ